MFRVRSDSDLAQVAMLRAGLGIGAIQHILAGGMPELVPVLAGEVRFGLELWVAMHEDQRGNAAVRAAFEVLGEGLGVWIGK
jgi:DNA-binding transcriptional LysR family regulator